MTSNPQNHAWKFGFEFLAALLLFFWPYGADQMGINRNFWFGFGSWVAAIAILIRMFWISPWSAGFSRLERGLISFIFVACFVFIFYKPVLTAYGKQHADTEGKGTPSGQGQAEKVPPENAPTIPPPTVKPIPGVPPPKSLPSRETKTDEPRTSADAHMSLGPCSRVQIGGAGNTATTNCTPQSRVLSEDAVRTFASGLSASKHGMLRVVLASSSDDAFPLAEQLCAAAQSVKWGTTCPNSRYSTMGRDAYVSGLACYSEDWNADDAVAFKDAMQAAHLLCNYIPKAYSFGGIQFGGTSGVTILIGSPVQP